MAQHSAKGSLCDEKPRRWVRSLLYINVFMTATEFLWTVMGTYFSIHDYISCQQDDQARPVIVAVLVVVCLSYLLIGIKVSSTGIGSKIQVQTTRRWWWLCSPGGHLQVLQTPSTIAACDALCPAPGRRATSRFLCTLLIHYQIMATQD